jgi:hypothetical protein
MYCPKCSQEQASDEMRFCSRCGFALTIVSQLIANGGALPGFETHKDGQLSPRQKGVRKGVMLMIISVVLLPLVALMTEVKGDFDFLFLPVLLVFIIGLTRLLYALLLEQKTSMPEQAAVPAVKLAAQLKTENRRLLRTHERITNWRQPVNTSEMTQPSTVTEHTTTLLKEIDEK